MSQLEHNNNVLIREITPRNILSFGPETAPLELGSLNVFIGPNGSGKSNFIDLLALLRATPNDMRAVTRRGGGVREWIWKGDPDATASLDVLVDNLYHPFDVENLRHTFAFGAIGQAFNLQDEQIAYEKNMPTASLRPDPLYQYKHGRPVVNIKGEQRELEPESVEPDLSILAQRRGAESYPEISYLADRYEQIRIYREWSFGRDSLLRNPQQTDMRNDRLEEDFSNLGLYLSRLRKDAKTKRAIIGALADLYSGFTDFEVITEGGTVQVFFIEGDFSIPASRLSDGSLRYLILVALLCDPAPAPLICIEEPELGLHPDILPKLADLLVSASERTQLIITTHSDILVDALSEHPEAVIVCEKHDGQTTMRRLEPEKLAVWLEKYTLGQLWTRGELGGTRW